MSAETIAAEPSAEKKISKSETGYAKNTANFVEMIIAVKSFGADYNPSAESLTIPGLETLRNKADEALILLQKADSIYRDSVNVRQTVFENMNSLITRIKGAVKSTGVDPKIIEEISALGKKITGRRISSSKNEGEKSVSRMSVDSRTYNFRQLVIRLADIPEYKPNEADLTIESLNKYIEILVTLTAELQGNLKNLSKARRERDEIMFSEETGLVPVAYRVKEYVKSIFGTSSAQFRSISGLKFRLS